MPKKSGLAAILLGGPSKDEGAGEAYPAGGDEDLATAGGEVFDALQAGDRDAFTEALHSYVKLCSMSEE